MSEWSIEHAWKACVGETLPWVRIPLSPPNFIRFIPERWVTSHSGDMGDTFGPKGFSIGSRRHVSSSKYPKSYCIKVTSQMRSLTWRTPTRWPAKTWLRLILRVRKQMRPHVVTVDDQSCSG